MLAAPFIVQSLKHFGSLPVQAAVHAEMSKPEHLSNAALSGQE